MDEKRLCFHCQFFKMTYKPQTPYLCSVFNFESKKLPSLVVYEQEKSACKAYQKKIKK